MSDRESIDWSTAIKGSFTENAGDKKFTTPTDRPDKITRRFAIPEPNSANPQELLQQSQTALAEIGNYGIAVIPHETTLDDTNQFLVTTADRLTGTTLTAMTPEAAAANAPQIEALCGNLVRYVTDAYTARKPVLTDIYSGLQYMEGQGENIPHGIYLTDVDAHVETFDQSKGDYQPRGVATYLNGITQMIMNSEEQTGHRFTSARDALERSLATLPPTIAEHPAIKTTLSLFRGNN